MRARLRVYVYVCAIDSSVLSFFGLTSDQPPPSTVHHNQHTALLERQQEAEQAKAQQAGAGAAAPNAPPAEWHKA